MNVKEKLVDLVALQSFLFFPSSCPSTRDFPGDPNKDAKGPVPAYREEKTSGRGPTGISAFVVVASQREIFQVRAITDLWLD